MGYPLAMGCNPTIQGHQQTGEKCKGIAAYLPAIPFRESDPPACRLFRHWRICRTAEEAPG